MFCIRTLLRVLLILTMMIMTTACSDSILDSKVLLAASKIAAVIKPAEQDSKIITPVIKEEAKVMSPGEVKKMIQSLRADVASSKQLAK